MTIKIKLWFACKLIADNNEPYTMHAIRDILPAVAFLGLAGKINHIAIIRTTEKAYLFDYKQGLKRFWCPKSAVYSIRY